MRYLLILFLLFSYISLANNSEYFNINIPQQNDYADHTFVFFLQGAADHYVPKDFHHLKKGWVNADEYDSRKILTHLKESNSINGLIIHTRRGKNRLGKSRSYFKLFARGKKIVSSAQVINGADPECLTALLKFAAQVFPQSTLHLIYRGHSLNKEPSLLFDANFPDCPYGIRTFKMSIKEAHVSQLGSISFAACKMKTNDVFDELAELNVPIVASEKAIIQSPISHGFSYTFLSQLSDSDDTEDVIKMIQETIFP